MGKPVHDPQLQHLLVRHPDGREYEVTRAVWDDRYKADGFTVVNVLDVWDQPPAEAGTLDPPPVAPPAPKKLAAKRGKDA